ncbi:uncharacterized protein LOC129598401 [Paramacrobiotus metropolitanus]|uniref:uncharacterized protein LOC129598401 n=1 Tax=Paramacrobiotus metropolitanus TaxID=2943436 RepID=UPI0024457EC9|nr:uncharacterized protein LOC129598401 [Paramacrobiotus metropolitanus]
MSSPNGPPVSLNLIPTPYHSLQRAYDPFLVDIIGDTGTLTPGYVCDVSVGCLSVQSTFWDPNPIRVPFNRLITWSVDGFREDPVWNTDSLSPSEALISRGVGEPAQWQSVRVLQEHRFQSTVMISDWWLVLVEGIDCQRYLISEDLANPASQRLRSLRARYSNVTQKTFRKTTVRLPERMVGVMRECMYRRSFWLCWSRDTQSRIIDMVNSRLTVLSRGPLSTLAQKHIDDLLLLSVDKLKTLFWVQSFLLEAQPHFIKSLLNNMIVFIDEEGFPASTMIQFGDTPLLVRIEVFSHLDHYERRCLQRVSISWQAILQCPFLRTDAIIPYRDQESPHHLVQRIQMSVTTTTRTVYLQGPWFDFLEPMAVLFSYMNIRLPWLVMVDNECNVRDFLNWDANRLTSALSQICRNIAFKRYSCYRHLHEFLHGAPVEFDYRTKLSIFIPGFAYSVAKESECDVQLALSNHLDEIIQPLESFKYLLIQACIADLNQIFEKPGWKECYWTTFLLCFTKWRVQPPRSLDHATRFPFAQLPRKNLVLHTLSMWTKAVDNQLSSEGFL